MTPDPQLPSRTPTPEQDRGNFENQTPGAERLKEVAEAVENLDIAVDGAYGEQPENPSEDLNNGIEF